jgi:hypothetical protein
MTLRWIEGFETSRTQNELTRKWGSYSGGDPYLVSGDGSPRACWLFDMTTPTFTQKDTWTIGLSINLQSAPAAAATEIVVLLSSSEQIKIDFTAVGADYWRMNIKRGSTTLETTELYYDNTTWYYLEIQVTPHATTGSYEIRIDSETVLSGSGVNTADTGSAGADAVQFISGAIMDNIYINDSDGIVNNSFLGKQVVEGILPNSDGTNLDWTPSSGTTHYNLVDDDPLSIITNDEVATTNSGDKDSFNMETLSLVEGMINGVLFLPAVSLDTAGTESLKVLYIDTDGTEHTFDAYTIGWGAGTMRILSDIQEQSPKTDERWAVDEIDDGEAGVELQ